MSKDALSYGDYLKAAFKRPYRMGVLGNMPLNQMGLFAFALLGLVNPGFWFLGVAAEAGYLAFLSSNSRFQRVVQGEKLLARQRGADLRVQHALAALAPEARERYRNLLHESGLILGIIPTLQDREQGTLTDLRAGGLNNLLGLFMRLLTSRQVISTNLAQVDRRELEADVEKLRQRLTQAPADGPLGRSIQATLEIQTKRLENLVRAESSLQVIDAELVRIENQVRLIREETAVSGGPEMLSARLDAVTQTLADTSRWMDENRAVLGDLAGDDLADLATELPRLDTAAEEPSPPAAPPPRRARKERS